MSNKPNYLDPIFGELLTQISDDEFLFKANSTEVVKVVKNWASNRTECQHKINEICETLQNGTYVHGMIYIAEVNINNQFQYVIYDGNHRLCALKKYNKSTNVFVNLLRNCSDINALQKRFKTINHLSPVPEIYKIFDDPDQKVIKEIIEDTVNLICKRFPKHISLANIPNKPNFNRGNLTDKLYNYLSDCGKCNLSSEELFRLIMELNNQYMLGSRIKLKNYSKKMKDKCEKTKCFLFLKDFTEDL
jgi:hypothetical protein